MGQYIHNNTSTNNITNHATDRLTNSTLNLWQRSKEFVVKDFQEQDEEEEEEMNDLAVECGGAQKNLEMMISGGDYSPNSHTFFKHPFPQDQQNLSSN
jgi:hypothetical protein